MTFLEDGATEVCPVEETLSLEQLEQAGQLLSSFTVLDDAGSADLAELLSRSGSLSALVDSALAAPLSPQTLQFFACYRLLLCLLSYEDELAAVLLAARSGSERESADSGLGERLDVASQLLSSNQTLEAQELIQKVFEDLASAAAALPLGFGSLVALGLVDLVEGVPAP